MNSGSTHGKSPKDSVWLSVEAPETASQSHSMRGRKGKTTAKRMGVYWEDIAPQSTSASPKAATRFERAHLSLSTQQSTTTWNNLFCRSDLEHRSYHLDSAFHCIEGALRDIATNPLVNTEQTVSELDNLLSRVLGAAEIAEGRMRVALRRMRGWGLQDKTTVQMPESLQFEFTSLREAGLASESAIYTAERLVLILLNNLSRQSTPSIEVEARPSGNVSITWDTNLRWIVEPSNLPWPGIKVASVAIDSDLRTDFKSFHFAGSVINHAKMLWSVKEKNE